MKIDTGVLSKAIGLIKNMVSSNSSITQQMMVYVGCRGDELVLRAFDGFAHAELAITLSSPGDLFEILLPFQRLETYVNKAFGAIDMSIDKRAQMKMIVSSGVGTMSLMGMESSGMNTPPAPVAPLSKIANLRQFAAVMRRVEWSANDQKSRPLLNSVNVTLNGKIKAVATDGIGLACRAVVLEESGQNGSVIIRRDDADKIFAFADIAVGSGFIGADPNALHIQCDDCLVNFRHFSLVMPIIDGKYPDSVETLIRDQHDMVVSVDRKLLITICEMAQGFGDNLFLEFDGTEVRAFSNQPPEGSYAVSLDTAALQMADAEIHITLMIKFLVSALKSASTAQVDLGLVLSKMKPIIITEHGGVPGGYATMLMPMTVQRVIESAATPTPISTSDDTGDDTGDETDDEDVEDDDLDDD